MKRRADRAAATGIVLLLVLASGLSADAKTLRPPKNPRDPTASTLLASYQGREMTVFPTTRRAVWLTLDAGGNAASAWRLLATLRKLDVRATFFLTGRWVTQHPLLARIIGRYFLVGNHSYTHPYLTKLEPAAVAAEIGQAQAALVQATGRDPRPLFRFPYGDSDGRTIGIANELGYFSARWTVDTLGWRGAAAGESVASIVERVEAALRPGAIILMHVGSAEDGATLDTDAIADVVEMIRAHGYGFIPIRQRIRK